MSSIGKCSTLTGVFAGLFLVGPTSASVINVDFNSYSGTYEGTAAAPDTGTFWNGNPQNPLNGHFEDLTASDGVTATTVDVTFDGDFSKAYGPVAVDINMLLSDYTYFDGDGTEDDQRKVILGGLTAGQQYDLYLYSYRSGSGSTFTIGDVSLSSTGLATEESPWVEGGSYVRFTQLVPDAQNQIVVNWSANTEAGNRNVVNGLQLVTVPEPSSMMLLGLGSLGLLRRRRI